MNFFNFGFQPGAAHTRRRVTATVLALAAWAALPAQQAAAQPQWPQRPVTLIVPFAPAPPTSRRACWARRWARSGSRPW